MHVGLLELELKVHHEAHPLLRVLAQLIDQRRRRGSRDVVLAQNVVDLVLFRIGHVLNLKDLALLLRRIVITLRDGREICAETHADHAGEELRETRDDDNFGAAETREAGRQGKGDGETVGETNDDVAKEVIVVEMAFFVVGFLGMEGACVE